MTNALWFLLVGLLMLTRGMTSTILKRLPFTSAIIYLVVGILLVPSLTSSIFSGQGGQSVLPERLRMHF